MPTQAKLSKALNSPAMVGSAVAMIEISIDASSTPSMRAPSTIQSWRLEKPGTPDADVDISGRTYALAFST